MRLRRATLVAVLAVWAGAASAEDAGCPKLPPCKGCDCAGGTGYRGPDGSCVGFKQFGRICGPPPHAGCVFENAPNTGLNRECALAPRGRTRESAPKGS